MREITHISDRDIDFPPLLRPLVNGPKNLYVRGDPAALSVEPAVAVVGTRRLTRYGEQVTRRFVGAWAARGVMIVSGLALGIDAVAHASALGAGGRTVAVLGSGVDDASIAPRSNFGLAKRIIASGGAVIAEYDPGTQAQAWHFPERNRIVAGLAAATVVIEGSMKSGTLITAKFALECGRDVFAVPGPVTCESSRGPNWLISQGAYPLCDPDDLLRRFGLEEPAEAAAPEGPAADVLAELKRSPASADDLALRLKLPTSRILELLTELELAGLTLRTGDTFSPSSQ
ncbi:DNA-processing protein DprA [Patescibacteria group bacterium]